MTDTDQLRRMATERDGSDALAALALSSAADELDRLRLGLQKIRDGEVEVGDGTVWSAMGMMQAVAEWTLEGKDISPIT